MRAFFPGPGLPGLILHALAPVRQAVLAARLRRTLTRHSAALAGCLLRTIANRPASCADAPLVFGVFPNGFTDVDGNELSAFRPGALQAQEILRATR